MRPVLLSGVPLVRVSPSRNASGRSRRDAGFTLLELLVVIVIVAVLAGMVVPRLGHDSGRDAAAAAERLVLLINRAREEAVLATRIWQIAFDRDAGSYRFRYYAGGGFEPVSDSPFAGEQPAGAEMEGLEVNGQPAVSAGEVTLYPTGEQDSFRLRLRSGTRERHVVMGAVGPARVESP